MDRETRSTAARCSVVGDAKLVQPAGGTEALCTEIGKALAAAGHADDVSVIVNVRKSHLTATVELADGKTLPEIGFAVSDSPLSRNAITRFALHIASVVRGSAG